MVCRYIHGKMLSNVPYVCMVCVEIVANSGRDFMQARGPLRR